LALLTPTNYHNPIAVALLGKRQEPRYCDRLGQLLHFGYPFHRQFLKMYTFSRIKDYVFVTAISHRKRCESRIEM
jgi:hypothetical protein